MPKKNITPYLKNYARKKSKEKLGEGYVECA